MMDLFMQYLIIEVHKVFYVNNDLLKKRLVLIVLQKLWEEFEKHSTKMKELGDNYYYAYAFFHQFYL